MSEEGAQAAVDIAFWRKRALEAEMKAQILEAQLGGWEAQCAAQVEAARAACHALQSYAHGNSAPDLAIEVAAKLEETIETDAGKLLLARLALYQEQLRQAKAWIRQAGHLDDCALQYGSACSCGKSDLTRGGQDDSS